MKRTKIIGWDFNKGAKQSYNADGSSSLETLISEQKRLQDRLTKLPGLIAQVQSGISQAIKDKNWLSSLSNSHARSWERDNDKTTSQAIFDIEKKINQLEGTLNSLKIEKASIPNQLSSIQNQLDALIQGEATGLERGVDKETAQELGEIELQKERERLEHERAIRQAEIEEQQSSTDKQGKVQNTVWIALGVIALLAIVGFIVYKRKMNAS